MTTFLLISILLQFVITSTHEFYSPNSLFNTQPQHTNTVRTITGYTAWGDSINTDNDGLFGQRGNPDPVWEYGYQYYHDGIYWYRTSDGVYYEVWKSNVFLELFGFSWKSYSGTPYGITQYYENPPSVIQDCLWVYILLIILYILYLTKYEIKNKNNFKENE